MKKLAALAFLLALPATVQAQGQITVWGTFNASPWVYDGPSEGGFVEVESGGVYGLGLKSNGAIVVWGPYWQGVVTDSPTEEGFTDVAAGAKHAIAIRPDGSLASWGFENSGVLSNTPTGTGFTQVSAGSRFSVALRDDGSIVAWGNDDVDQVSGAPAGTGFKQITSANHFSVALHSDGTLSAWGSNFETAVSSTPTGQYIHVAAGGTHGVAVRQDGTLVSWGSDFAGLVTQTPSGSDYVKVAAGHLNSMALRSDGSVVVWGNDIDRVVLDAPVGNGYTSIALGTRVGLAIRGPNLGDDFCFGDGTGSACPCFANGPPGRGCANTTGTGARLKSDGSAYLDTEEFEFRAFGLPGWSMTLLFQGTATVNGGAGNPLGDGLLCVAGTTKRSQPQVSLGGGSNTFTHFQGQPFADAIFEVGVRTYYQAWYRNPGNTCSGLGFNFSNGVAVTWLP